jgi:hypothetical protein
MSIVLYSSIAMSSFTLGVLCEEIYNQDCGTSFASLTNCLHRNAVSERQTCNNRHEIKCISDTVFIGT